MRMIELTNASLLMNIMHKVSIGVSKGCKIQFLTSKNLIPSSHTKRWIGKYVRHIPTNKVFKVLFAHTEGGHTWLHSTTAEDANGLIAGFDARYCKIITQLEYGIEVGL